MASEVSRESQKRFISENMTDLAASAQKGFVELGRGALLVVTSRVAPEHFWTEEQRRDHLNLPGETVAYYTTIRDFQASMSNWIDTDIARAVNKYDPERQMVVVFAVGGEPTFYVIVPYDQTSHLG